MEKSPILAKLPAVRLGATGSRVGTNLSRHNADVGCGQFGGVARSGVSECQCRSASAGRASPENPPDSR